MAEAVALFGAVAAAVQCADIGARVLLSGSTLCSKLSDAPDKVKIWLGQIEQLNALTDSIRESCTAQFQSLPPPSLLPSSSPVEAPSASQWIKSALEDCSVQALSLEALLKKMLRDVDDGKRKRIWKTILTVKRESKIEEALQQIERQKSMLDIWLSKTNVSQSVLIHQSVNSIQGKLDTVGHDMVQLHHTSQKGFSDILDATRNSSEASAHQFEEVKSVIVSSFSNPERLLLENLKILQRESAARELQSHAMAEEMKAMKIEFKRFRKLQCQAAQNPTYLKEILDVASNSQNTTLVPRKRDATKASERSPVFGTHTVCWCRSSQWFQRFSIGRKSQLALHHRRVHTKDCAVHQWTNLSFATSIYYQFQFLNNLMTLSFSATYGAGGFSIGPLLQTTTRVEKHFLEPFFEDLYGLGYWRKKKHRYKSEPPQIEIAQKVIWRAFQSGAASPNDIDSQGRTLIHLQTDLGCFNRVCGGIDGICGQMIRLLISMGTKTGITDDSFDTAQQKWLENETRTIRRNAYLGDTIFNENLLEWNSLNPPKYLNAVHMVDCARRWPESVADFGCPYISDIVLRKSKADLELFIFQGMEPLEENERGFSPLHLAAAANWPDGVELLIAGGADNPTIAGNTFITQVGYYMKDGSAPLIKNLALQGSLINTLRPFRDLAVWPFYDDHQVVVMARKFYQAGFTDLDSYGEDGMTQLIAACNYGNITLATFLMEAGANVSICHRDSSLTAGHFLIYSYFSHSIKSQHLGSCTKLLQAAFDRSDVVSYCRCSPEGYSLITSLITSLIRSPDFSSRQNRRNGFHLLVDCLRWSGNTLEQQARAFAMGETFNRLEMTHTCISLRQPGSQIPKEDRLEIEEEEEEFNDQLQAFMDEYDALRAKFKGSPVEFLDVFLEKLDHDFLAVSNSFIGDYNSEDKDLLGPGRNYNRKYRSYKGEWVYHGHVEEVKEVNCLSLLFDESLGNDH